MLSSESQKRSKESSQGIKDSKGNLVLSSIALGATDRGIILGQTGSGKTTLAKELLGYFRNVCIIDIKGLLQWEGYFRYTTIDSFIAAGSQKDGPTKLIYAPTAEELRDPEYIDRFFRFMYMRNNTMVYVDEVYAVTDRDTLPPHYHAILTRGRERGIGLLSASQRPIKIPSVIMSEAEHWYIFRLSMIGDRKKIEDSIGLDEESVATIPKRFFRYCRPEDDPNRTGKLLKLTLRGA